MENQSEKDSQRYVIIGQSLSAAIASSEMDLEDSVSRIVARYGQKDVIRVAQKMTEKVRRTVKKHVGEEAYNAIPSPAPGSDSPTPQ